MADFLRIDSERLYMRPFKDEDAESMLEYHSDPEICRYIPWDVRNLAEVQESIEKNKDAYTLNAEGDYLSLALIRKSDDQLIGQMNSMYRSTEHKKAEFGYVINPKFGGQGYASEAASALITALFDSGLFHRVIANIDVRNDPSWKLVERIGMRREAHYIQDYWFKGEWTDSYIYAVLKSEWPIVR